MSSQNTKHFFLILGLVVVASSAQFADVFLNQPEELDSNWQTCAILYAFGGFLGTLFGWIALKLKKSELVVSILLAFVFYIYFQQMLSLEIVSSQEWRALLALLFGSLAFIPLLFPTSGLISARNNFVAIGVLSVVLGNAFEATKFAISENSTKPQTVGGSVAGAELAKSSRPKYIFHILFDAFSGTHLLADEEVKKGLFFDQVKSGVYFNNAYANGHKTYISTRQLFSGSFWNGGNYLDQFRKIGYVINRHVEFTSGGPCLQGELCKDREWVCRNILYKEPLAYLKFEMLTYYYLYLMRLGIDVDFDAETSKDLKHMARGVVNKKKTPSTPMALFEEFLKDTAVAKPFSYNYLHVKFPHAPYVHNDRCELIGDNSHISTEFGDEHSGYLQQQRCANKLADDFLSHLQKLGVYEESLVIIQSDHGSGRGYLNFVPEYEQPDVKINFQEAIDERGKIVLWVKPPHFKKKVTDTNLAMMIDIAPTVQHLAGLDVLKNQDGIDLLDSALIKPRNDRLIYAYNTYSDNDSSVYYLARQSPGSWRLIQKNEIPFEETHRELKASSLSDIQF